MRIMIRKVLSSYLNEKNKKKIKKLEFRIKSWLINKSPKISRKKFEKILVEKLGLRKGDHVFCHASFSHINTDLSEAEVCDLIFDIIGESGSLTVPCYPPMSSYRFMQSKRKFSVRNSISGMGSFSEVVRRDSRAFRTLHPTKSIASIGLGENDLGCHDSKFPFGEGTPYERLLKKNVKVIGLGVSMSYLSFVHVAEELDYANFPIKVNLKDTYSKKCIDYDDNEQLIETYIHDIDVVTKANPEKFVKRYVPTDNWLIANFYFTPFFQVDACMLTKTILDKAKKNVTIYD